MRDVAERENWPFRDVRGRGGRRGGLKREYQPPPAVLALIKKQEEGGAAPETASAEPAAAAPPTAYPLKEGGLNSDKSLMETAPGLALSPEESALLARYRRADADGRRAIQKIAEVVTDPTALGWLEAGQTIAAAARLFDRKT